MDWLDAGFKDQYGLMDFPIESCSRVRGRTSGMKMALCAGMIVMDMIEHAGPMRSRYC